MQTTAQLTRIQEKVQLLIRQCSLLEKENYQLKEELSTAKVNAEKYSSTAEELKQQVDVMRFGNAEMDESGKKEFEKRINGYVKEIDRCIAMLSE